MKKKFKLFATIGSLALAVCMMTIGVLAASTVSLTVNSTVSFSLSSVFASVEGKLDETSKFTGKTYRGEVGTDAVAENSFQVDTGSLDFGTVSYSESKTTAVYEFVITNDAKEGNVTYTITAPSMSAPYSIECTTSNASGTLTQETKTATISFTITLGDFSKSATSAANFTIKLDYAAA